MLRRGTKTIALENQEEFPGREETAAWVS